MEDIYVQSLMLDQYGELLTSKQREILQMYLAEDLSLGEIAQVLGISRQGVSDSIHRSISILEKTESKLHIAHRSRRIAQLADQAAEMIRDQLIRNQMIQNQMIENQMIENQTVQNHLIENQTVQNQSSGEEIVSVLAKIRELALSGEE